MVIKIKNIKQISLLPTFVVLRFWFSDVCLSDIHCFWHSLLLTFVASDVCCFQGLSSYICRSNVCYFRHLVYQHWLVFRIVLFNLGGLLTIEQFPAYLHLQYIIHRKPLMLRLQRTCFSFFTPRRCWTELWFTPIRRSQRTLRWGYNFTCEIFFINT